MHSKYLKSALLLIYITLAGCAGLTPDIHRNYVDRNQSASKVAIVRAMTASIHKIDGKELKHPDPDKYYSEIHLPPGPHTITLYRWFAVSVLLVSKGYIEVVSKPFSVNLEAGHIYELHGDRTTGVIRVILWIEDSATGEIIAREVDPQAI
jgi:hypothetical protein